MSKLITIELPDELTTAMREAAKQAGQTLEDWAAAQLRKQAPTAQQRKAAMARLLQHTVDNPSVLGSDNQLIDRDLAEEYHCHKDA